MDSKELHRITDPNKRRLAITDYLAHRAGRPLPTIGAPSPEDQAMCQAITIWDQVNKNVARPLMRALKHPDDYQPDETQLMLGRAFQEKFGKLSKDEMCFLLSVMHAEELEKQVAEGVKTGNVGEDFK